MSDDVKAAAERLMGRDLADYQGPTGDDTDMRAAIVVARAYIALAAEAARLREEIATLQSEARTCDADYDTELRKAKANTDRLRADGERLRHALEECDIVMDTAAIHGLPQELPDVYRNSWARVHIQARETLAAHDATRKDGGA